MTTAPLLPLEHFFDNPERSGARLSPDGQTISFLAPRDGVLNIWVRPRGGGPELPITDDRNRGIRSYFWSRDGRYVLYVQDSGGDENYHVYAVDPRAADRVRDLTPFAGIRAGIVAAPRATPRQILVSMNRRDPSVFDVYALTLASGKLTLVAENPGNIIGWTADRNGVVRAARAQTPTGDFAILVRDAADGPFRQVAEYANEDDGDIAGFVPDGTALWVASARDADLTRLVELDLGTGLERVIDADDRGRPGGTGRLRQDGRTARGGVPARPTDHPQLR